jgi:glycosyltransferase involved in cell wall biosynthesis
LRLGFHCHIPAIEQGGKIWMPGHTGLFVDSLAAKCEMLVCFQHSPLDDEADQMDYAIQSINVRLENIGPHKSIPSRTAVAITKRYIFRRWQEKLDAMLVRVPTPLLPILASFWNKPFALLVVGDYVSGVDALLQPRWRKEIIRLWSRWNQHQQMRIAKRSITFVNSHLRYDQLCLKLPNLIETQTTTLRENDFYYRTDTCLTVPYRLLYTGRLIRAKGVFDIVESLSQLVFSGFNVVLDLVGMVDKADPVLDDLNNLARSFGIEERIRYHGYKPAGVELLKYYRQADIYISASQILSEGFPRTIWEAMASSLPVVATKVGSVPAFISGAAVLIPRKNVPALTQAVKDLLTMPDLRQKLIREGMVLARDNTLEKRAEEMVTRIEQWLDFGTDGQRR